MHEGSGKSSERSSLRESTGRSRARLSNNRRGIAPVLLAVIVIVVAIVVVVGGLFAAGVLKLGGGGGGPAATTYSVSFLETGLAHGTSWTVTLSNGDTQSSTTTLVTFSEPNGSYSFSVGAVAGYSSSPASGTFAVAGANVNRAVTFTAIPPTTYTVTFTESGLPSGTSWSVTLNGAPESSTTSTISFTEPNGTYSYTVGSVSGYTASPSSGSVTVSGASVSKAVTFTAIPPTTYTVTFTESGLPSGTSWSVTLNGVAHSSSTASITFTEVNGTYSYTVGSVSGYTATPSGGSVTVAGAGTSVSITFSSFHPGTQYQVTFAQTGLPLNDTWQAIVYSGILVDRPVPGTGAVQATSGLSGAILGVAAQGSSFKLSVPAGGYSFYITSVTNDSYQASPTFGNFTVTTGPVTVNVQFSATVYSVTFTETGLPGGADWSITLDGASESASVGSPIIFSAMNGSHDYVVSTSESGYAPTEPYGSVTVNGQAATVSVTFAPAYTVTFTETGLATGVYWDVELGGRLGSEVSGTAISFTVTNGNYAYSVTAAEYSASPASGTVSVSGSDLTVPIHFTVAPWLVTFTATGLSSGKLWSVTLNGTYKYAYYPGSITFNVTNGAYFYSVTASGYRATPSSGTVTVANRPVTVPVTFARITTYPVVFTETGLPPTGSYWMLEMQANGAFLSSGGSGYSTNSTLTVYVPNGNYTWFILSSPDGYVASPFAGGLIVSGGASRQTIAFSYAPNDHLVLFQEFTYELTGTFGIPNGSSWSVTIGGATQSTTGMYLGFNEPNGTYAYTITGPSGYVAVPASGQFTVDFPGSGASYLSSAVSVYPAFVASGGTIGAPSGIHAGDVFLLQAERSFLAFPRNA